MFMSFLPYYTVCTIVTVLVCSNRNLSQICS